MDTFRRILGILLVVGTPPGTLFWFALHPFIGYWRKIGIRRTYWTIGLAMVLVMTALYLLRTPLLGRDLGTRPLPMALGLALYLASVWLSVRIRKQLPNATFAGLTELRRNRAPSDLLTTGIYGQIRHPRYLATLLGGVGLALMVNHLGVYLVVAGSLSLLLVLIPLEERELVERFGGAYEAYRADVPALLPRYRRANHRGW